MNRHSVRAALAQLRLDVEMGLPAVALATGLLILGDVALRRLPLGVSDPTELRGAFALLVLACLAAALPLVLVGRDRAQLFLALPLGLRRVWLSKLVVTLALMAIPTLLALVLAGAAWGKMTSALLGGLCVTYVALALVGLTAALHVRGTVTSLALGLAWTVAAFGSAALAVGGLASVADSIAFAIGGLSLLVLVVLSHALASRILTEHDRRWRMQVVSFAPLLVLPALYALNLAGPKVFGPLRRDYEKSVPSGGLATSRRSVLFPQLTELVTLDERTATLHRDGLRRPMRLSLGSVDWSYVPSRRAVLHEADTGDFELTHLGTGARAIVGRGHLVRSWPGRTTHLVGPAPPDKTRAPSIRLTRIDEKEAPIDVDVDAERAQLFLHADSSRGITRLDGGRLFAWAVAERRAACVMVEGGAATPRPVIEAAGVIHVDGLPLHGSWLAGRVRGASRKDSALVLLHAANDAVHGVPGAWENYHHHPSVRTGSIGLMSRGEVRVIDLTGVEPVVQRSDRREGKPAAFGWHFTKDGARRCRLDPDRPLFSVPSGIPEDAFAFDSRGDVFVARSSGRLRAWHVPSGASFDFEEPAGDACEAAAGGTLEVARLDEASGQLRLAWWTESGIVTTARSPGDDRWSCQDSRDLVIAWHRLP